MRSLLGVASGTSQEMYPLISKTAAAAGWADPTMDDYDRYDELRPARSTFPIIHLAVDPARRYNFTECPRLT